MQLKTLLVAGLLALVAKAELQAFPRYVSRRLVQRQHVVLTYIVDEF
jgi:hypothetical protein